MIKPIKNCVGLLRSVNSLCRDRKELSAPSKIPPKTCEKRLPLFCGGGEGPLRMSDHSQDSLGNGLILSIAEARRSQIALLNMRAETTSILRIETFEIYVGSRDLVHRSKIIRGGIV